MPLFSQIALFFLKAWASCIPKHSRSNSRQMTVTVNPKHWYGFAVLECLTVLWNSPLFEVDWPRSTSSTSCLKISFVQKGTLSQFRSTLMYVQVILYSICSKEGDFLIVPQYFTFWVRKQLWMISWDIIQFFFFNFACL